MFTAFLLSCSHFRLLPLLRSIWCCSFSSTCKGAAQPCWTTYRKLLSLRRRWTFSLLIILNGFHHRSHQAAQTAHSRSTKEHLPHPVGKVKSCYFPLELILPCRCLASTQHNHHLTAFLPRRGLALNARHRRRRR